MGEWKLVLGSFTRNIKGMKSRGTVDREEEIDVIVTSDEQQFVMREFIKSTEDNSEVEIDGVFYKTVNNKNKYLSDFPSVVRAFIKHYMILIPDNDINPTNDVIKIYEKANEKANELYGFNK